MSAPEWDLPEPFRACDDYFVGRNVGEWCKDCNHVLAVHTQARICSVCEAIAEIGAS